MFRRKLMINIIVFVVCGAITLTIPVLVKYWQQTPVTAGEEPEPTYELHSKFVGNDFHLGDTRVMWQIYLTQDEHISATWEEIYSTIKVTQQITYDTEHLQLTPNGFRYRGLATAADYENLYATGYSSTVNYQGFTCTLTLE